MKTFMEPQGSLEWLQLRLGVVTASEVDALITPLWKTRTGDGVETYLCQKICEKTVGLSNELLGSFSSFAMEQGQIVETMALPWYELMFDAKPLRVGFCTSDDGKIGCSPDGLIGQDGGLEIKSPQGPKHVKYLLRGEVPPDYRAQVHFSMLVTGRAWWDFVSFHRELPPLVIRVQRDERIIAAIQSALDEFMERFDEGMAKIAELKNESAA